MPVTVSFVLIRTYLEGSFVVQDTDDPERAIEFVQQVGTAELIENTTDSDWQVDAWIDEPPPGRDRPQRGHKT